LFGFHKIRYLKKTHAEENEEAKEEHKELMEYNQSRHRTADLHYSACFT